MYQHIFICIYLYIFKSKYLYLDIYIPISICRYIYISIFLETKGKVSLPVSLDPNTFSSSNKGVSCRKWLKRSQPVRSVVLKAMWKVTGYVRIFNTQSVRRIRDPVVCCAVGTPLCSVIHCVVVFAFDWGERVWGIVQWYFAREPCFSLLPALVDRCAH